MGRIYKNSMSCPHSIVTNISFNQFTLKQEMIIDCSTNSMLQYIQTEIIFTSAQGETVKLYCYDHILHRIKISLTNISADNAIICLEDNQYIVVYPDEYDSVLKTIENIYVMQSSCLYGDQLQ